MISDTIWIALFRWCLLLTLLLFVLVKQKFKTMFCICLNSMDLGPIRQIDNNNKQEKNLTDFCSTHMRHRHPSWVVNCKLYLQCHPACVCVCITEAHL